jgi:hypothetical protein
MKTLTKEFAQLGVTVTGDVYSIETNEGYWRDLGGGVFVADTYFDLAGLSMDHKSLFFQGAAVQEIINPSKSTPANAGDRVRIADIMSVVPLTDLEAAQYITGANLMVSNSANITFDQTVFGRVRLFNIDLDNQLGGYMVLLSDNQTGSLSATASDRVYCYRVVAYNGTDGRFDVYGARYLLRAEAKEEPEYEYLMRLKRSYELQNEPDRD